MITDNQYVILYKKIIKQMQKSSRKTTRLMLKIHDFPDATKGLRREGKKMV